MYRGAVEVGQGLSAERVGAREAKVAHLGGRGRGWVGVRVGFRVGVGAGARVWARVEASRRVGARARAAHLGVLQLVEKHLPSEGHWVIGSLGHWGNGALGHWGNGTMGHWGNGAMGQWGIWASEHWAMGH